MLRVSTVMAKPQGPGSRPVFVFCVDGCVEGGMMWEQPQAGWVRPGQQSSCTCSDSIWPARCEASQAG